MGNSRLFKISATLTDIHFGKKSDSPVHNQDCLDFIEWFCQQAAARRVDRIIMAGDWFDNQSRLRVDTITAANRGLRMLREVAPVEMIVGNHDMFFKGRRDVYSVDAYSDWEHVTVHNTVKSVGGVGFCPFLVGPEYLEVADLQADYVFGHFELPTFLTNGSYEYPDHGGLNMDHLMHPKMTFSGHFHKRQLKQNGHKVPIWYIGSPFGHDFNDVDDPDHGMMFLEWGGEPEFLNWRDGPLYQRFLMSEIIDMLENNTFGEKTRRRSILEVKDDIGLELEQVLVVREEVLPHVREIKVLPTPNSKVEAEVEISALEGKSIEDIVVEHLNQVDPRGSDIDPLLLVSLFKGETQ